MTGYLTVRLPGRLASLQRARLIAQGLEQIAGTVWCLLFNQSSEMRLPIWWRSIIALQMCQLVPRTIAVLGP